MSKYNKLPGLPLDMDKSDIDKKEYEMAPPLQKSISKLCCLPILMEGNKAYKNQLNTFMTLEELLPKTQRNQIYQMLYMDKLLDELRSYQPPENDENPQKDFMDVIMKTDAGKNKMFRTISAAMKMKQTGDISALMGNFMPANPMMSMLLPMLTMQNSSKGNTMEGLLPMLMGGGAGANGNMLQSLLPMMMGNNMDMLSSLF